MRAAENVWAIGDVTGIALFTHVGKYHARIAAYDMAGRDAARRLPGDPGDDLHRSAGRDGRRRLEGSDLDAGRSTSDPAPLDLRAARSAPGFVKVAADPERRVLTGAVAVGPEAGEWLQQLTLAIRAETPIDVLLDVIQPYPTFSEAIFLALRELNLDL